MSCEHCGVKPLDGRKGDAMITMAPGPDGKPWDLCLKCWIDGRFPGKLGRIKIEVVGEKRKAS